MHNRRPSFLLAAMAMAMATPMHLGAQRLDAEALVPAADTMHGGNSPPKPGKHHRSGTIRGAGPRHSTTFWKGAPNNRNTAREQRNHELGRNIDRVDYYAKRMEWNKTVYPRVLELQAKQRARSERG